MNYPTRRSSTVVTKRIEYANRGLDFEKLIICSCNYYLNNLTAVIYKRPTPIRVVKVDYSNNNKIVDAYFEKQSTTDFNGIYKGKYIDFECKETNSKTSFSFSNITKNQIDHLKRIKSLNGISFFLICFKTINKIFLLDSEIITKDYDLGLKSIKYAKIEELGREIPLTFAPRIDFLKAVDEVYLNEKVY